MPNGEFDTSRLWVQVTEHGKILAVHEERHAAYDRTAEELKAKVSELSPLPGQMESVRRRQEYQGRSLEKLEVLPAQLDALIARLNETEELREKGRERWRRFAERTVGPSMGIVALYGLMELLRFVLELLQRGTG